MEAPVKLLHIDSSILGDASVSRLLSADVVAAQRTEHPGLEVIHRDLGAAPIGHLSGAHLAAAQGAVPADPSVQRDVEAGRAALEDFLAADVVVIGAPMYNFGVPSQLKAWIDRIAVAGVTFRYTEAGPEGLAGGKRIIVASSRGGFYGPGTPGAPMEHQESYLRAVFGFLGVKDITFVRAEGVALGSEARERAIEAARDTLTRIAA
jgi:FMN-dependent NADH-azoreductase